VSNGTSGPIGVAVVGAGGWGKNHVRTFAALPGAELRYVCDRSTAVLEGITSQHPTVTACTDLRRVLSDDAVRGVIVATDAPNHFPVAKAALEAGKDVLVEKPLALSAKDADALVSLAAANGRVMMVGHLLLFHAAVQKLRELIEAGELGEVLYVTTHRLNLGVVRRDENAWWSLAPHDISLVSYLLGSAPTSVSATGGVFLQKERGLEDVVFASLSYPAGKMAHVHVSWLDPHKTRRLVVVGSKKMAVFDDTSSDQKLVLFDKGVEAPPSAVGYAEAMRVRMGDILIPALKMTEPLRKESEAFLAAIRTRQVPLADGRSGADVVRVLEAGSRSLANDGRRTAIGGEA
jgi:predicted dehydrogenase